MTDDMAVLDVTNVIISEDKLIACLFDGRYGSIAIVRIVGPDKKGEHHLEMTEPDGEERLYWLDKFGLMSDEDMNAETEKLSKSQRRRLYEKLKKELG